MLRRDKPTENETILKLKYWQVATLLAFGFVFFHIAGNSDYSAWVKPLNYLAQIPWSALRDGCFATLLISFVYEVWVRKENLREFHAAILSPQIIRHMLPIDEVEKLAKASFQRLLQDDEFGHEMFKYFQDSALNARQQRENQRIEAVLLPLGYDSPHSYTEAQKVHWYNVRFSITYERVLINDVLKFLCVAGPNDLRKSYSDKDVEWRWMALPMTLFTRRDRKFYQLLAFRIFDRENNFISLPVEEHTLDDGHVYFEVKIPKKNRGSKAKIQYDIEIKVMRFGHTLSIDLREPTRGYNLSFDYGAVDIGYVTAYPLYASPSTPRLSFFPSERDPSRIEVQVDGWSVPDSGTSFSWVLKNESNDKTYRETTADTGPQSTRSSIVDRA